MTDLTPQLEKTIAQLQKSRNPIASQVLAAGLNAPESPIRQRIVQALAKRPDEVSLQAILLNFDTLNEQERKTVPGRSAAIRQAVSDMMRSDSTPVLRAAVSATCHFGYIEHAKRTLEIASDTTHPLSPFAQDQVFNWARRMGQASRFEGEQSQDRLQLLDLLKAYLEQHSRLPSNVLLDALVACMHWDDALAHTILSAPDQESTKVLDRYLRRSTRTEAMEFLAGFLFRRSIPDLVLNILKTRDDEALGVAVGEIASSQSVSMIQKNAIGRLPLACIQGIRPGDQQKSQAARAGVWHLKAASNMRLQDHLAAILEFLDLREPWADKAADELLRWVPPFEWESGCKLLSDTGRNAASIELRKLLQRLDDLPSSSRRIVEKLFPSFQLELFCKYLQSWDPSRLEAAAWVIRTIDPDIHQKLAVELQSPAPLKRERAVHALCFFDAPDPLWEQAMQLFYDSSDAVRVRAIESFTVCRRTEAASLMKRLVDDTSSRVQSAAFEAVQYLESDPALKNEMDKGILLF